MNLSLLLRTLVHLKPIQLFFQVYYRIWRPHFRWFTAPNIEDVNSVVPIVKLKSLIEEDCFTFLNQTSRFSSWNDDRLGMLWTYNLNYMDWLGQDGLPVEVGAYWVERFIEELPHNKIGLAPYPIALRGINWIKFISKNRQALTDKQIVKWNDALYSQYKLLQRKLEFHLLGNHLLEDAYSLFIASIYFSDKQFYKKAVRLLLKELNEQVLPDGAHFEQSPMYHCILLDRLLDCYGFSCCNIRFEGQEQVNVYLGKVAIKMLGHLHSITYTDGTIPLFNDSAYGIAPAPKDLFDYACRLGLVWIAIPMKECGYRKLSCRGIECIVDVGNMTATYQLGHSHADTFNYELRLNGQPFIVDAGISTYNKNRRRQLERSTAAHNTVTVNGISSSEVWSGFRIGKRAKVVLKKDAANQIIATHDGFGRKRLHTRAFRLGYNELEVKDHISSACGACSYIHFASDVTVISFSKNEIRTNRAVLMVEGASKIIIEDGKVSREYNRFLSIKLAKIYFTRDLKYTVYS